MFTGGIGHGSPMIRRRVCEPPGWTGIRLDAQRYGRSEERLSSGTGPAMFALRSDEEGTIAREAQRWWRAYTLAQHIFSAAS